MTGHRTFFCNSRTLGGAAGGAAIALLGVILNVQPARACAACGCGDPTLTTVGLEKLFSGRLRISTSAQYRSEHEGNASNPDLQVGEWLINNSTTYAPWRWMVLGITVPLVNREVTFSSGRRQAAFGLGDISTFARVVVWQDSPTLADHIISLQAQMTFPSSPLVSLPDGAAAVSELQTGRGSWVPALGINYSYFGTKMAVFASLNVRIPMGARFGDQAGFTTLGTVLGQIQPWDWLALQLGIDTRYALPSKSHGETLSDTGGFVAFASPGIAVSPVMDLLLSAMVRIPAIHRYYGEQGDGPMLLLSIAYDLPT